jgi:hypothetical protein
MSAGPRRIAASAPIAMPSRRGERFSVLQRTQTRGFKGNFETLKQKTGCFFFWTEVFLDSIFSFLLIFYVTIFSPHETSTRGEWPGRYVTAFRSE